MAKVDIKMPDDFLNKLQNLGSDEDGIAERKQYRYKILGKPATCDGEFLFLFKLNDFELFLGGKRKGSYLPSEWRDYFGVPAEEHEVEYKVNLAEGYITTDKV